MPHKSSSDGGGGGGGGGGGRKDKVLAGSHVRCVHSQLRHGFSLFTHCVTVLLFHGSGQILVEHWNSLDDSFYPSGLCAWSDNFDQ